MDQEQIHFAVSTDGYHYKALNYDAPFIISREISSTGHNSVIQVPGKDEWYIVYHRFQRPEGIKMGDAAGFHREVCIDRMQFDGNGNIIPVVPTNISEFRNLKK